MGAEGAETTDVLDVVGTLDRLGGDQKLFAEMASFVLEDAPTLLQELNAGIEAGDSHVVQMKAHALKSLVAGCGGIRTARAAQKLEDAGSKQNLVNAASLMANLESELQAFLTALQAY